VVQPPFPVRAFDPCLWIDPLDRLWLCWTQSFGGFDGRDGVFAAICEDPDAENPVFGPSRRLFDGLMMNKPTVLSDGTWLFPAAVWSCLESTLNVLPPEERLSAVWATEDQGKTFTCRGGADVPNRHFDEHMVIERKDGGLWMLVRRFDGVGQSFSYDGGRTWTPGGKTAIIGPDSRFFIRRLNSGALLLINHASEHIKREKMSAWVSDDDGLTWQGGLMLDERMQVSYPDGVQAADGKIYIIHDFERYGAGELVLSVFTEEDVRKNNPAGIERHIISRLSLEEKK